MSEWKELAHWMYGDVLTDRGFWYSHPLYYVRGLDKEELFWVPDENCLCMLWHVGHIAHGERLHIGRFLQSLEDPLVPPGYDIFGHEWCPVEAVREAVDDPEDVFQWVTDVRQASTDFIANLNEDDWHKVPETSEFGLTIANWLFITVGHEAIHLGKVQMMRAMLEGRPDPPC